MTEYASITSIEVARSMLSTHEAQASAGTLQVPSFMKYVYDADRGGFIDEDPQIQARLHALGEKHKGPIVNYTYDKVLTLQDHIKAVPDDKDLKAEMVSTLRALRKTGVDRDDKEIQDVLAAAEKKYPNLWETPKAAIPAEPVAEPLVELVGSPAPTVTQEPPRSGDYHVISPTGKVLTFAPAAADPAVPTAAIDESPTPAAALSEETTSAEPAALIPPTVDVPASPAELRVRSQEEFLELVEKYRNLPDFDEAFETHASLGEDMAKAVALVQKFHEQQAQQPGSPIKKSYSLRYGVPYLIAGDLIESRTTAQLESVLQYVPEDIRSEVTYYARSGLSPRYLMDYHRSGIDKRRSYERDFAQINSILQVANMQIPVEVRGRYLREVLDRAGTPDSESRSEARFYLDIVNLNIDSFAQVLAEYPEAVRQEVIKEFGPTYPRTIKLQEAIEKYTSAGAPVAAVPTPEPAASTEADKVKEKYPELAGKSPDELREILAEAENLQARLKNQVTTQAGAFKYLSELEDKAEALKNRLKAMGEREAFAQASEVGVPHPTPEAALLKTADNPADLALANIHNIEHDLEGASLQDVYTDPAKKEILHDLLDELTRVINSSTNYSTTDVKIGDWISNLYPDYKKYFLTQALPWAAKNGKINPERVQTIVNLVKT